MNNCTFVGKVYRKPEMKQTSNGISFCKFFLMVERKNFQDFVPIQAWRDTAEKCCESLVDGSLVFIHTSYQTGSYEKEGQKNYTHNFVAREVYLMGQEKSAPEEMNLPF